MPEERVIEYRLRDTGLAPLGGMTVRQFVEEAAAESAAPGGGSVAALVGALGASLGTMVADLSAHKRGWDERWEEFSRWAEQGQHLNEELLRLVDEDTRAFNRVMAALALPRATDEEKAARSAALAEANVGALMVPYEVMKTAFASFELLRAMAEQGNPASASDAGVGALCARTAVRGAWLNVRTNVAGVKDKAAIAPILADGERTYREAAEREAAILELVEQKVA